MLPSRLPYSGAHWVDRVARHAFTGPNGGSDPVRGPAEAIAVPVNFRLARPRPLASYRKPTGIVVLGELPRNASGKVLKHELRTRYGHSFG
jgi:acyl-CoA synthetase (AMP-forming)/AMP-acid ligase II